MSLSKLLSTGQGNKELAPTNVKHTANVDVNKDFGTPLTTNCIFYYLIYVSIIEYVVMVDKIDGNRRSNGKDGSILYGFL